MDTKFYEMLIQQANHAADRTRWIVSVATIASLAQLGAAYNFSLSLLRTFTEQMIFKTKASADQIINTDGMLNNLQTSMVRNWTDLLNINVNLLGIKFSVVDASLIGSVALLVISVWLFYSTRKENHIIARTCRLANTESPQIKAMVYYGLQNTQMFCTISAHDKPIISLHGIEPQGSQILRYLVGTLFYLPVVTVFCMVAIDLLNIHVFSALFRGSAEPLIKVLKYQSLWDYTKNQIYTLIIIKIMIATLLSWIMYLADQLRQGSTLLLRELQTNGWDQVATNEATAGHQPDSAPAISHQPSATKANPQTNFLAKRKPLIQKACSLILSISC